MLPLTRKILGLPDQEEVLIPVAVESSFESVAAYEYVDDLTESQDASYYNPGRGSRDLRPRMLAQRPKKVKRKSLRARKTRVKLDDDEDFEMNDEHVTPEEESGSGSDF